MHKSHIQWAVNVLSDNGYQVDISAPDEIQNTPWSQVYRIQTNHGHFFLKKVPPALLLELKVIQFLHEEFSANVPIIIAENQDLHCFLMKDAGIKLHDYYIQKSFQADLLIQAMNEYTNLQISSIVRVNDFVDLGVPDWRLQQLPQLYLEFISHEDLLVADGLTNDEIKKLRNLESKLYSICEQLLKYNMTEAFGHADFHDKNILVDVDTKKTTLIDLGEVVITHPLFSFHNCLYMAKERFSLSDEQYCQLEEVCFKPWLSLETKQNLFDILSIIKQCWSIHAVLGEFRLMKSVDKNSVYKLQRHGRLANKLRVWID